MARIIALLRGVNVGGNAKLPMAELRAACADAGLGTVTTYIASGNLALDAVSPAEAERTLAALIAARFGLKVGVIARTAADWAGYVVASPFPTEAAAQPNRLMLALASVAVPAGADAAIAARAANGEIVRRCGDGLAIFYPEGAAETKLTPAILDRAVGSPVTQRNWNTVLKLAALAGA